MTVEAHHLIIYQIRATWVIFVTLIAIVKQPILVKLGFAKPE
jgi:hypothetical protein